MHLKLSADSVGTYLKREGLLTSLPARMKIVARAVVRAVREQPDQYLSIKISEATTKSLALSLKNSKIKFRGLSIGNIIEDYIRSGRQSRQRRSSPLAGALSPGSDLLPPQGRSLLLDGRISLGSDLLRPQRRSLLLGGKVSTLGVDFLQNEGIEIVHSEHIDLDIDRVRVFVSSVIWTSGSDTDIVRKLAEAIEQKPKSYFAVIRTATVKAKERSYPSSTRSRPDPAMC